MGEEGGGAVPFCVGVSRGRKSRINDVNRITQSIDVQFLGLGLQGRFV